VRDRTFPTKENSASIDPAILEALDLGDENK
jgi:hypothetical protein